MPETLLRGHATIRRASNPDPHICHEFFRRYPDFTPGEIEMAAMVLRMMSNGEIRAVGRYRDGARTEIKSVRNRRTKLNQRIRDKLDKESQREARRVKMTLRAEYDRSHEYSVWLVERACKAGMLPRDLPPTLESGDT